MSKNRADFLKKHGLQPAIIFEVGLPGDPPGLAGWAALASPIRQDQGDRLRWRRLEPATDVSYFLSLSARSNTIVL